MDENSFMNIKLARIHNRNMLMKMAQAAQPPAAGSPPKPPATTPSTPGSTPPKAPGASPSASQPATAVNAGQQPVQQPAQQNTQQDPYKIFVQRHQLQALENESWLKNLFYAYRPEPSTKMENDLAGAVRRATGTSSDGIQEHLANATTRLPAAKDTNLRDKAVNEYGKWNEQTRAERQRLTGQAESQKSQDAQQAYQSLIEWNENTDDPSWLFLTDQVSSSALKQAQSRIVRDVERAGMSIVMGSPTSWAAYISDEGSFFNTVMEQGFVSTIQGKGSALPFDVVMGWAQALNEPARIVPQYTRFAAALEKAGERDATLRGARGIRDQATLSGLQSRLDRQNARRGPTRR